jgi:hypothetical protein
MYRYKMYFLLIAGLLAAILFFNFAQTASSQTQSKLVKAKDGSGIIGYKDTPILPWCGFHVHDPDRPAPPKVTPGILGIEEKAGMP